MRSAPALLALVACALAACDGEPPRPALAGVGHGAQTVVVGRPADALSLDPARPTDSESAAVITQVYETLVRYRPGTTTVEPGLAVSWQVDESGRMWTFELRPGVRFHDGTALDADAVVFSFERQRDPTHPFHTGRFRYWESAFRNIERVEAAGPRTVRVHIADRYAPFLANMTMFPASIVSPRAAARWRDELGDRPAGTGPFRVERWDRGERIVLARFPGYWGPQPAMERVVFRVLPDARQRLVDLESGAIDLAHAILPEELQFVALHPGLALYRPPTNNVTYLAMNCARPPFDDVRVRRAVNLAIHKQAIVRLAYQGLAVPASGPLPPTQWGAGPESAPDPAPGSASADADRFAPDEARALVAAAVAAGRLDLGRTYTLYASSTPRSYLPNPERVARIVQANLAAVGLRTDVVLQPFEIHKADLEHGRHDLALAGWVGDNGDPDNYLFVLFDRSNATPGRARNFAFYRDPTVSALLRAAQGTEERRARERLYAEVQRRLRADAPWVPLAHSQMAIATRDDISGIAVNAAGHVIYAEIARVGR